MTASIILGACLPQKPPASTARPNPYVPTATVDIWIYNESAFGTLTVDKIKFTQIKETPRKHQCLRGFGLVAGVGFEPTTFRL